jgi:hypothetical protein
MTSIMRNVKGIPHKADDPARAEFLAGRLLEASELVLSGLRKNRQSPHDDVSAAH